MPKGTWRAGLGAAAVLLVALVACSSSEEASASTEASFCSALTDAYGRCSGGAISCGDVMHAECTKLATILSPSVLTAATGCFQSATCDSDPLTCLGTSLVDVKLTEAQTKLATDFCATCAQVSGEKCEQAFFGLGGTPGLGLALLPFGDAPMVAVGETCTASPLGKAACQAAFPGCVTATVPKVLAESISTDAVKCLVGGIKDGLAAGGGVGTGGGSGACTGCAGCCDDGQCRDGQQPTACGTGGAVCELCAKDATCTAGKCASACGPDSCSGCCDANGQCQTGGATAACGSGGGACAACTGSNTCDEGACIDPGCKASCVSGCCTANGCQPGTTNQACGTGGGSCSDCGTGRTCGGGKCTLGDTSTWDFKLVAAHLPAKNADNGDWDAFSGLPDARAAVTSGAMTGTAPPVGNTLNPVWNALPLVKVTAGSLKAQLRVELWDADPVFDDHIGVCTIALTGSEFDGALHTVDCPAAAGDVAFKIDYRLNAD